MTEHKNDFEQKMLDENAQHTPGFARVLAETTLKSIPDGVVVTDTSGRILNINPAAEQLTGYRESDIIGKPIEKLLFISEWDSKNKSHPLHHVLQKNCTIQISRGKLTTKGKPDIHINGSVSIMLDDGQQAIGAILLFRDVSDDRKMAEQVHHYATFDQLTGLVNRSEFEIRLQHALDSAIDKDQEHVLCYLDLDQFKIVNDTCGHAAGDELLRQLGILLSKHIRNQDTLGRIGGDEFALLLENCPLENAIKVAETLRGDIENFRFTSGSKTFYIAASIGLVVIDNTAISVNNLFAAADQACFAAKELGRNRVKIFTASDEQLVVRSNEMHWVSRLHDALSQDHFVLYCQPIVDTRHDQPAGKFTYYELMVRLKSPDNTILLPGAFLPAAERYGLITAIDRWIITHYFQWLHDHPAHARQLERVSINLSGQSLGDETLLQFIREQFSTYSIPVEKICFEITETAAIANLSDAMHFINKMRDLNVKFALDDFGTGMSSFSYLKQLPIDILKIDGSFIKDILTDKVDASLVKTIVEISKTMGMKTVAEYVESMDIYKFIQETGVNYGQGDGICKPLPIDYLG